MVKWLLILLTTLCFNLETKAQPFTSVSFSVQAHQDDWQLFMSSKVMADMAVAGRKVVFITLTAGDESCGPCSYAAIPFYLGRENGAMNGVKFAADLALGSTPLALPAVTSVSLNSHNIAKYTYKNTVNYFLRLPDGGTAGTGFTNNGFQSLERLKSGAISSISTIGVYNNVNPIAPTATYTWTDLINTLKAILIAEKVTGTQSYIHTAHTITGANTAYNDNDHSDHRYASLAVQLAATATGTWLGVNGFTDYASTSLGPTLNDTEHENSTILFSLEVFGMIEGEYQNEYNENHKQWLPMDGFTVIKTPTVGSNAPFSGAGLETPTNTETLMEAPMIVSVFPPAAADKDVKIYMSPFETGTLTTSVYDMAGNEMYSLKTNIEKVAGFFVTLKDAVKGKGTYVVKSILNDKYTDSRKLVVQ